METPELAETPSSNPTIASIKRLIPKGNIFSWTFLPAVLLLFTVGVAFLKPCPLTQFLPFLSILSAFSIFKWRTAGLSGSFLAFASILLVFYKEIPRVDQLWQMGAVFTLAVNSYIFLLCVEQVESEIDASEKEAYEKAGHLHQLEIELQNTCRSFQEEKKSLSEEIEQLKEEAEQRRIEKHQTLKQLELTQSELDQYNRQKQQLVNEAFETRKKAHNARLAIEDVEKRREELQAEREQLKDQNGHLSRELAAFQEKTQDHLRLLEEEKNQHYATACSLQEQILKLQKLAEQTDDAADPEEVANLKRERAQYDGLYRQLRAQFEEKSRILSETRKELYSMEGKWMAAEKDQQLSLIDPNREELSALERYLDELSAEVERLEAEQLTLEELVSHALSQ